MCVRSATLKRTTWRYAAPQYIAVGNLKDIPRRHFVCKTILNTDSQHKPHGNAAAALSQSNTDRAVSQGCIITGGTSGIGFAVARAAIKAGASHVRIITRYTQSGREAVDKLLQETASNKVTIDYIEAQPEEYEDSRLFHFAGTKDSPFKTVVHCAGAAQTSLLSATQSEDIRKILDINLVSAALLSKSLLKSYFRACVAAGKQKKQQSPLPAASQSWQLVTISSLLAERRGVGSSIYAASKSGLIALTRAVALEGAEISQRYNNAGPSFRANVVTPGYIETPMTSNFSGSYRGKLLKTIPTGRFGKAEEVADAVMFLLGNEYANNCVLNLDGGLSGV